MQSQNIRNAFLEFFIKRGHEHVSSSSLIPAQDPTLLFTNAGMNQFKDLFLQKEQRTYKRAVSVQKCLRAGGKHNDLDQVGFTSRHLTFFEMLGNFSFGDYFKQEAIEYAWHFITQSLGLREEHLYISCYEHDNETYDIWHATIGIPKERLFRLGAHDNFWQMGETGPCGPCTEIYIDRGPSFGCKVSCKPSCSCDRFLELWNLVFIQFNRNETGRDVPLAFPGVDTGMGLERACMVLQDKASVFETDLFQPFLESIGELASHRYEQADKQTKAAFHVLADHIRASSLLIADGCSPSNEGRGYVLRKLIRRAALFAEKITPHPIFPELSSCMVATMGTIYPELVTQKNLIYAVLKEEIEKFKTNLTRGRQILLSFIDTNKSSTISGKQAFTLYDTFGFPLELVTLIAKEHNMTVNEKEFDQEMDKQKKQSGRKEETVAMDSLPETSNTTFTGYDELTTETVITSLVVHNKLVQHVEPGVECFVITQRSPFFIVGGGQVPDQGWFIHQDTKIAVHELCYIHTSIAAKVSAQHALTVGDPITAFVDPVWRNNAMKNHTATHLLQAALIKIIGKQVKQAGSLVHPDYLRFDFSLQQPIEAETITAIEQTVNNYIQTNIPVVIEYTTMKDALKKGALAFFGDKYNPEHVRVVSIPSFSSELCGGTHVSRTGDIGAFKITDVTSLSAGHKRIVAVTGPKAIELFQEIFSIAMTLKQKFKVPIQEIIPASSKQDETLALLRKQLSQTTHLLLNFSVQEWKKDIRLIHDIPFLALKIDDKDYEEINTMIDKLQTVQPGVYFILNHLTSKERCTFVVSIHPSFTQQVDVASLKTYLTTHYHLKGGGSATSIKGGGPAVHHQHLFQEVIHWLEKNIKK
ncbi:MAG: alanine--tRNA ligase [Candidatus Babeliales bacterium]